MKSDIYQALQIIIIVLFATFIAYCVDQSQWGLLLLVMFPSMFIYSICKAVYYFMTETGKQHRETNKALKGNKGNIKHDYR